MSTTLLVVQILNGLQLGVLLFLIAAGLTLVFGVMDFINLAHGVQYMLGAYLAVAFYAVTGNFLAALILALAAALLFGLLLEFVVFRQLYGRDHLDHVIATFGVILFVNHGVKIIWGAAPLSLPMPELLSGSVRLAEGLNYPVWRLVIIAAGLIVAALLYVLVTHTRIGMLVRAGATNAAMVSALGVDIRRLFMIVFGFGAMLAGFAGIMIAPILSVDPGMGDTILILAFVVIVIGGIGSIRGAFLAALLIGLVDTLGRSFSVDILRLVMGPSQARTVGPAIASMLIYLLMAVVLYVRPTGPFPANGRCGGARSCNRSGAGARPLVSKCLAHRDFPDLRRPPASGARRRRRLPRQPRRADHDLRRSRGRARSPHRLLRSDLVRPRRLHWPRRLCGGHAVGARHYRCAHCAADRARGFRTLCLPDRHRLPAHDGRLFHHDHPRLRPDGLLHCDLARALWRRRRPHHRGAQHRRGLCAHEGRARLLLRGARVPRRQLFFLPRARCLALRSRAARRQGEFRADGDDRFQRLPLPARRLCDRGSSGGPVRLSARQCHRVREPRLYVVAALGRAHRDGAARRPGLAQRRDPRHRGLSPDGGVARRLHRELEGDLRAGACGRRLVRARRADRAVGRVDAEARPWLSLSCASTGCERNSARSSSPMT